MAMLNHYLLMHNSDKFVEYGEYKIQMSKSAEFAKKLSGILLASSIFMVNTSSLSRIYGFIRIPALIYLDSIKHMMDPNVIVFFTRLIFGVEMLLGAFLILLNKIYLATKANQAKKITNFDMQSDVQEYTKQSTQGIKNDGTLMLLIVAYAFVKYLMNLFQLPFEMNETNKNTILEVSHIINLALYLVLANSMCESKDKQTVTIKNPDLVYEKCNQHMKSLIEFPEA